MTSGQQPLREFKSYERDSIGRKDAATHLKSDPRKQAEPKEPMELDSRSGASPGILLFLGLPLHSTVQNRSGIARWDDAPRAAELVFQPSGGRQPRLPGTPPSSRLPPTRGH